jgi:T5orf172 domain
MLRISIFTFFLPTQDDDLGASTRPETDIFFRSLPERQLIRMTRTEILHTFPSFCSFDQTDDDNKCIFPAKSNSFQRCQNTINRKDLAQARLFRNAIAKSPSASNRFETLRQYASLRCCKGLHRKMLSFELASQVAQNWLRDLGVESQEHLTHASTAGLQINAEVDKSRASLPQRAAQVVHGYNLRSRIPDQDRTPSVAPIDPQGCAQDFQPYLTKASQTVLSALIRPLSDREQISGSLYMYTRSSSPGFVKIGLTTTSVPERLSVWQRNCKYVPILQHEIHNVPNVYRVESLIHFQLAKHWRREKWCKKCRSSHQEWFEIDIDTARKVMDGWVEWISTAMPFDANGCLKDTWRTLLNSLEAEKSSVTAQILLDSISNPFAQSQNLFGGRTPVIEGSQKAYTENTGARGSTPLYAHSRQKGYDSAALTNALQAIIALSTTDIERLFQMLENSRSNPPEYGLSTPALSLPPIQHSSLSRNEMLVQSCGLEARG